MIDNSYYLSLLNYAFVANAACSLVRPTVFAARTLTEFVAGHAKLETLTVALATSTPLARAPFSVLQLVVGSLL